ncbi:DNA polymerase III subunit delta [Parasalinivibrio latis]|uniref:DNA polymerase III subunit delta n=1 Tax=Parasalinivibrio latis TaxID=2952610 RepID=UPI0030DF761B
MRIYPEQLSQSLEKGLLGCYLLFGSEPLLKQESKEQIRHAAKAQGFDEIHRFNIDAQLDWDQVYDCCQALSLFSNRQVIELTVGENGLNTNQANALKALAPQLNPDILLVIDGPRLNKKQESTQWFTLFNKLGTYIPCNTPEPQHLPRFVDARCKKLGLRPDRESIQLLSQWHEGNLLALSQSLLKLQLLYPDGVLTLPRIQEALSRHNHFTPFQLVDAFIAGQGKRAVRILGQLEAEGTEATILLRIIQKELVQLYKMQEMAVSGIPHAKVFDQFRVWQNRRQPTASALQRLPLARLGGLIHQLAAIEVSVKTDYDTSPWPALQALVIELCTGQAVLPTN